MTHVNVHDLIIEIKKKMTRQKWKFLEGLGQSQVSQDWIS